MSALINKMTFNAGNQAYNALNAEDIGGQTGCLVYDLRIVKKSMISKYPTLADGIKNLPRQSYQLALCLSSFTSRHDDDSNQCHLQILDKHLCPDKCKNTTLIHTRSKSFGFVLMRIPSRSAHDNIRRV